MLYASGSTLRTRSFPEPITLQGQLIQTKTTDGTLVSNTAYNHQLHLPQFTWSEGHPISILGSENDLQLDIGGPFLTGRLRIGRGNQRDLLRRHKASGRNPANTYTYEGVMLGATFDELNLYKQAVEPDTDFETTKSIVRVFEDLSATSALQVKGTTAIARTNPTKQQAGLFVALRETYNDGLPMVPGVSRERVQAALRDYRKKRAAGVVKGPAEEYLNLVFGVMPLLADAKALKKAMKAFDDNFKNFQRNAEKTVRRKYNFPSVSEQVVVAEADPRTTGWPGAYTNTNVFSSQVLRPHNHYKVVTRSQRFSGAYTYYLDFDQSKLGRLRELNAEADYLFGAGLTLENIWNSSPWTWLVDWYSNAGDVLANLSSMLADNLVLRYGYMTERVSALHSCDCGTIGGKQIGSTTRPITRQLQYEVTATQRIRATPFGFGLSDNDLSIKQKLILAALGITRV